MIPVWDLSEIYKSINDPRIEKDLKQIREVSERFEKKHRGKVAKYNLAAILKMFSELNRISEKVHLISSYSFFMFSSNTQDQKIGALMQKVELRLTEAQNHFIFIDLELAKNPQLDKFINSGKLGPYQFTLERLSASKKHQLSQEQEEIINQKSLTARSGWVKLFSQTVSGLKIEHKKKELSIDQALNILHSANRAERKEIFEKLSELFKKNQSSIAHIYNMLLLDKIQEDKLRKYKSSEEGRHIDNGVTKATVDALVKATQDNYHLVSRFYNIKKKLLGLDQMYIYDRYAPVQAKSKKYEFLQARHMIDKAFASFDQEFAQIFNKVLNARHVDARPMPGKRGGAYCADMPNPHLPYIQMTYLGELRDIETLAHESGHAIQDVLVSGHPLITAHPPLTLAETSSIFAEMIMFENLSGQLNSDKEKIALYAAKIDDVFATIFRQICMFTFEREVYQAIQNQGQISADQLNQTWRRTQLQMYGKSVKFSDGYEFWWSYISHFFEYPFYVYAYAFGNLLVFSLYKKFKDGETQFVEKYKKFLAQGGTKSTMQAVQIFGFDLEDPQFWQNGFDMLESLIVELETLVIK